MPNQRTRIPTPETAELHYQHVRPVDERCLGLDDARPVVAPWVKRHDRHEELIDLGASEQVLQHQRDLLSKDKLLEAGNRIFSNERAAAGFDGLIANYAHASGQLKDLYEETQPRFIPGSPNQRLLTAIFLEPPEYKPGDRYKFAELFLDPDTPQEVRQCLVALHSAALQEAQENLEQQTEQLNSEFTYGVQRAIEEGILPETALPDPEKEPHRYKRLQNLRVLTSDPPVNILADRGGHYECAKNTIQIGANIVLDTDPKRLRRVYFHERFHANSGLTTVLDGSYLWSEAQEDEDILEDFGGKDDIVKIFERNSNPWEYGHMLVRVARVGLRKDFDVLNEGYTEWAAMQISGQKYKHEDLLRDYAQALNGGDTNEEVFNTLRGKYGAVYLAERIMLASLVAQGVDILTIGEAYFESYQPKINNPTREAGTTVPARRALDAAVATYTPYRSSEHLLRLIAVEEGERYPNAVGRAVAWNQAEILASALRSFNLQNRGE